MYESRPKKSTEKYQKRTCDFLEMEFPALSEQAVTKISTLAAFQHRG